MRVRAGRLARLELFAAKLPTGGELSLPVTVIHGQQDGPRVFLSAAIHGDELNGVSIIRRVLKHVDPKTMSGTLIAVPVVNVFGLISASRYLPDRRDLNRSFPGAKRGSLAKQLAHLLMSQVVERCTLGIDLHAGSGGRTNLPQLRCDLDEPEVKELATVFGAPVVLHAKRRAGSLRAEASKKGVRILLYETGEAHRFDEAGIELGAQGVLRVLERLKMLNSSQAPTAKSIFSLESGWVRARRSGFCEMRAELGKRVGRGDPIAVIFDALLGEETIVRADSAGIVIGHLSSALVHRGDAIAHIAQE